MNDQQAESDVEHFFSTLEDAVGRNLILKYSLDSCVTERISKFSDQSSRVVSVIKVFRFFDFRQEVRTS